MKVAIALCIVAVIGALGVSDAGAFHMCTHESQDATFVTTEAWLCGPQEHPDGSWPSRDDRYSIYDRTRFDTGGTLTDGGTLTEGGVGAGRVSSYSRRFTGVEAYRDTPLTHTYARIGETILGTGERHTEAVVRVRAGHFYLGYTTINFQAGQYTRGESCYDGAVVWNSTTGLAPGVVVECPAEIPELPGE